MPRFTTTVRSAATLALVLISASVGACSSVAAGHAHESVVAARVDDAPIRGSAAVLTIHGMSCPLCANNVDKTLGAVPGVSSVHVNMKSGEATVALSGSPNPSTRDLASAVDKSGFTLVKVEVK